MKKQALDRPAIWMITADFYPGVGGAEKQAQRLIKSLISGGYVVRVITRKHGFAHLAGVFSNEIIDGIPVKRIYSRGPGMVGSVLFILCGVWYLLRHGRRDIFHAHDVGAPAWLAMIARFLLGGKCLIKLRTGMASYQKEYSSGISRWQFSLLLRKSDKLLVTNQEVEKWLLDQGFQRDKIVFLPNGVDENNFFPNPGQKEYSREKLGLPVDKTLVLYMGRLSFIKGVDILLRAWNQLPSGIRQTTNLVIVGDGEERQSLERDAEKLNIADSILFMGMQENVRDFYWAADLFVLSSRAEGLSNALLEAMACGLPVVVSRVGGAPDLLLHGKNGYLFETENVPDFACYLKKMLLHSKEVRKSLGLGARQRVIEYASLGAVLARLEEVYKTL